MCHRGYAVLLLAIGLGAAGLTTPATGQPRKPADKVIRLSAAELLKECNANSAKAAAKYKGKTIRVTGVVEIVTDEVLYLKPDGADGTTDVVIRYEKRNKPAVKAGDTATFQGTFDQVEALGPALIGCKMVKDDAPGKKGK